MFTKNQSMVGLLESLRSGAIITKQSVYDAMLKVDRKDFTNNPYHDHSQPIGYNVVISAPHIHAHALEMLSDKLKPGCRVLDVGFGSGYLTVALSKMMDDKGLVVGVEHIKELYDLGYNNIMKSHSHLINEGKIKLANCDGRKGYAEFAPYHVIQVGAAAETEIPKDLLEQLAKGGRMVIPCGTGNNQFTYVIDKMMDGSLQYKKTTCVCFVPLTSKERQLRGN